MFLLRSKISGGKRVRMTGETRLHAIRGPVTGDGIDRGDSHDPTSGAPIRSDSLPALEASPSPRANTLGKARAGGSRREAAAPPPGLRLDILSYNYYTFF